MLKPLFICFFDKLFILNCFLINCFVQTVWFELLFEQMSAGDDLRELGCKPVQAFTLPAEATSPWASGCNMVQQSTCQ